MLSEFNLYFLYIEKCSQVAIHQQLMANSYFVHRWVLSSIQFHHLFLPQTLETFIHIRSYYQSRLLATCIYMSSIFMRLE